MNYMRLIWHVSCNILTRMTMLKNGDRIMKGLGCFKFSLAGFSIVVLCHGRRDDRDFFAFVAIEPGNYHHFKKRYRAGEFSDFKAYGYELIRGWGTEPSQSVRDTLRSKYGVEFGVSENFLNQLTANIPQERAALRESHAI